MIQVITPLMSSETGILIGLLAPLLVGLVTPLLAVRSCGVMQPVRLALLSHL